MVGMSLRLIRSIRLWFGAVKLLSGDGDHRPYRVSSSIFVIFLDLIPETGQPNRGRDDRPGRPIDTFPVQGSKIAIGRWGPSSLPVFTFEHPSIISHFLGPPPHSQNPIYLDINS
jgi:hypothetical protein